MISPLAWHGMALLRFSFHKQRTLFALSKQTHDVDDAMLSIRSFSSLLLCAF
jgi:hypothetical protein